MAKTFFVSPVGIAQYPHIVQPDTEGQYATNKHTTKLVLTPEEAKPLIDKINEVAATHKVGKNCKKPWKAEQRKDGDSKVDTGNLQFSFSSKFAPALIDPSNKPINTKKLSEDFNIGSGSKIRIAGEVYSYDKGISLQMSQVQIVDLVSGRNSMFDAVEGTFDGSEYEEDDTPALNSEFEGAPTALSI
jgi:hypothetical protein